MTKVATQEQLHGLGVINALNVGGRRKPRTNARGLTDTLVTRADGSQYVIPRRKSTAGTTRKHKVTRANARVIESARISLRHDFNEG